MRAAPNFWTEPPRILANLLLPIAAAWDSAARLRHVLSRPYHPPVPVICIGNLVAGGAGKTPVALAVTSFLTAEGRDAHIVTRGYGGRLAGPVQVNRTYHDAAAVGDEALLLAARSACWVARDRAAGVRAAVAAGADIVLLDDGFQNPAVAKTLSILVVDAQYGFGNRRVIPAGPLRERLHRGLARADSLVLLGGEAVGPLFDRHETARALPVLPAVLAPVAGERFRGSRVLAFAGIGRPEKFFTTLRRLGAVLVDTRSFPDHYPYQAAHIDRLRHEADRTQARLVTTAKDIVRVPPANRSGIEVLEVEIRWANPPALGDLLRPIVPTAADDGCNPVDWHH
jgi:tetraacyldisaccharide 4'-kinase